ncbi:unnamed protein product [Amoebophrya sp. A120]|nr:unnamed protein product [Amoebophrya sp. A120]|eukprot:GSA120T00021829001.1
MSHLDDKKRSDQNDAQIVAPEEVVTIFIEDEKTNSKTTTDASIVKNPKNDLSSSSSTQKISSTISNSRNINMATSSHRSPYPARLQEVVGVVDAEEISPVLYDPAIRENRNINQQHGGHSSSSSSRAQHPPNERHLRTSTSAPDSTLDHYDHDELRSAVTTQRALSREAMLPPALISSGSNLSTGLSANESASSSRRNSGAALLGDRAGGTGTTTQLFGQHHRGGGAGSAGSSSSNSPHSGSNSPDQVLIQEMRLVSSSGTSGGGLIGESSTTASITSSTAALNALGRTRSRSREMHGGGLDQLDRDHNFHHQPQSAGVDGPPPRFDFDKEIFPSSIVWCSICGLTWLFPVVGHMGIADEKGDIYEFMGLGASCGGGLAFGPVLRYIPLKPASAHKLNWNDGLSLGNRQCRGRSHKGCVDNCHTYVADVLNNMQYGGFKHWNSVILALWVFFCGRYTSVSAVLIHWAPSLVILLLVLWQVYKF